MRRTLLVFFLLGLLFTVVSASSSESEDSVSSSEEESDSENDSDSEEDLKEKVLDDLDGDIDKVKDSLAEGHIVATEQQIQDAVKKSANKVVKAVAKKHKNHKHNGSSTHVNVNINLPCNDKHKKKVCLKWGKRHGKCLKRVRHTICVARKKRKLCSKVGGKCVSWKHYRFCTNWKKIPGFFKNVCTKWQRYKKCTHKHGKKYCAQWGYKNRPGRKKCVEWEDKCFKKKYCADKGVKCVRYKNLKRCIKWTKPVHTRGRRCVKWDYKKYCKRRSSQSKCIEWGKRCKTYPGKKPRCILRARSCCKRWAYKNGKCAKYKYYRVGKKCTRKKYCARYRYNPVGCIKWCKRRCKKVQKWSLVWTEPHLQTLDGDDYIMNWIGPLWLIKPFEPSGFAVQVWSHPAYKDGQLLHAAVFKGLAVRVGTSIAEFWAKEDKTEILLNKEAIGTMAGLTSGAKSVDLDNGGKIAVLGNEFVVASPKDHSLISIKFVKTNGGKEMILDINVRMAPIVKVKGWYTFGLLGNWDGKKGNSNILERKGELVVPTSELFFSSTLPEVPNYQPWGWSDLEKLPDYEAKKAHAKSVCQKAGLGHGYRMKACMYDVLITGEDSYALGSASAQKQIRSDIDKFGMPGLSKEINTAVGGGAPEEDFDWLKTTDSEEDSDSDSKVKIGKYTCKGGLCGYMSNLWCRTTKRRWGVYCPKKACRKDGRNRTHMCKVGKTKKIGKRYYSLRWRRTYTYACEKYCCKRRTGGRVCAKWAYKNICTPGKLKKKCIRYHRKKYCANLSRNCPCQKYDRGVPGRKVCKKYCKRYSHGSKCVEWGRKKYCAKHKDWHKYTKPKCTKYSHWKQCIKYAGHCTLWKWKKWCIKTKKCKRYQNIPGGKYKVCLRYAIRGGCSKWRYDNKCLHWRREGKQPGRKCINWCTKRRCNKYDGKCLKYSWHWYCHRMKTTLKCVIHGPGSKRKCLKWGTKVVNKTYPWNNNYGGWA